MSEYKETDRLYIEFIESLDMFVPGNDCADYRDQNDYRAMGFMLSKIKSLEADKVRLESGLQMSMGATKLLQDKVHELERKLMSEGNQYILLNEATLELEKRLEEANEANRILKLNYQDQMVIHLHEKLALSVETLELYGDPKNWELGREDQFGRSRFKLDDFSVMTNDTHQVSAIAGRRARAVLKQIKGEV